jgi:uncharacterized SAM-binding protein YcdF (DUF218 family)
VSQAKAVEDPYMKRLKRRRYRIFLIGLGAFIICSYIPLRLAFARHQAPTPQAILVLDGNAERIDFAAQFSTSHPTLPIWISPGGSHVNQTIFRQAATPAPQIHFDFCAVDTVTNFTCNVDNFTSQNVQHVYLITSDYHMRRSLVIAAIVFGSQGIVVTPISVSSEGFPPESPFRIMRDFLRSMFWVVTGRTGPVGRIMQLRDFLGSMF